MQNEVENKNEEEKKTEFVNKMANRNVLPCSGVVETCRHAAVCGECGAAWCRGAGFHKKRKRDTMEEGGHSPSKVCSREPVENEAKTNESKERRCCNLFLFHSCSQAYTFVSEQVLKRRVGVVSFSLRALQKS